jgi:hypothetical protein
VARLRPLAYLLVCLTCALSCAPDHGEFVFGITFDPCQVIAVAPADDTTADELASIDDAIEMWNTTGATRLTREDAPGVRTLPVVFEDAFPAFYGIYVHEEGYIVVNRKLGHRSARAITIAHEIGHAFGMLHVPRSTRSSLMNTGNLETPPDDRDAAALAALWGSCEHRPVGVAEQ